MLNTRTVLRAFLIVTLSNLLLVGCGAGDAVTDANTNIDTVAPVITINGDNPVNISEGVSYSELGATAIDDVDGVISSMINVGGTVDTSAVGSYVVTYDVIDSAGNAATQLTRIVNVIAPTVIVPLNDTGITWGGNYPAGDNVTCIGETISEQDCANDRDAQAAASSLTKIGGGHAGFDFTKLDSNGDSLAASAVSWSCVKDNHTGLVWETKTTTIGVHNKDNVYKWGVKTALFNDTFGTRYNDWDTLVDGANDNNGLCGYTDWRVPSHNELLSIIQFNDTSGIADNNYFPFIAFTDTYWTSSAVASDSTQAWFWSGGNYSWQGGRASFNKVILVRGGR